MGCQQRQRKIRAMPKTQPALRCAIALIFTVAMAAATAPMGATPAANPDRTFFIDSTRGNDDNRGTAALAGASAGQGPWKSLARLARASLQPGDRVVLACGSVWRETLLLAQSGDAAKPILITAPAEGCSAAPTIDGSVDIPATAWNALGAQHLYQTVMPQVPLQLHGAGNAWRPAHYPNPGHDSAHPLSYYLPMAGPGDTLQQGGRLRSTSLIMGIAAKPPAGAGAVAHIRTNSWAIETQIVSAVQARKLTFENSTVYPTLAGWGYFLTGEAWMVDSPGEWHYTPATQQLTAFWPGNGPPAGPIQATVLPIGVDLRGRVHITLVGIAIRRVGIGLQLEGTRQVELRQISVDDTAGVGAAASASNNLTIESSRFTRTGLDAIQGVGGNGQEAEGMAVRHCTIRESGVRMANGVNIGLPVRSFAAIYAGPKAVIEGNIIQYSGYIGIRFMPASRIEGNVVDDSCLVLNDCGAIYTWGSAPNNSQVLRNIVRRAHGNLDGTLAGTQTAAQGIYLDDNTTGVLVAENTATEADHGMQVHIAQRNTLRDNVLFNNRRSQLWMQADSNAKNPAGDVADNEVTGNLLGPAPPGGAALLLHSGFASTSQFGRFEANRFLDATSPVVARERTKRSTQDFSFNQWRNSRDVGSTQPVDNAGFSERSLPFAPWAIAGDNLIANSALAASSEGWQHWNASGGKGQLLREQCLSGTCLRYQPGDSPGLLSSPGFSLQQGQYYRLSMDVLTDTDGQVVRPVVRRAGGTEGIAYESLSDRPLSFTAGNRWQRQVAVFQATKTAKSADAAGRGGGARIDLEQLAPGRSLSLANLELVPLVRDIGAPQTISLVNALPTPQAMHCPLATTLPSACSLLHRLSDGKPVIWPLTLPAHRSELLYALNPAQADSDRDGIPDRQDRCPDTPLAEGVNAAGCGLSQR